MFAIKKIFHGFIEVFLEERREGGGELFIDIASVGWIDLWFMIPPNLIIENNKMVAFRRVVKWFVTPFTIDNQNSQNFQMSLWASATRLFST